MKNDELSKVGMRVSRLKLVRKGEIMMQKTLKALFILGLIMAIMVGCQKKEDVETQQKDDNSNQEEASNNNNDNGNQSEDEGSTSSDNNDMKGVTISDDLVKEAKDDGKVVIYSATSRIKDAAKSFEKKYGIDVEATNIDGSEMITKVAKEGKNNAIKPDLLLAQEAARVKTELVEPGYAEYNVPDGIKDVVPKEYQDPLDVLMVTKVFIYNSETFNMPPIDNIWELTESKWKGKFFLTDPHHEGVNLDFLTMVTKPEIAKKIKNAYKRYYGKDIDVTEKNAGYQWLKEVFKNNPKVFNDENQLNDAIGTKGKDIKDIGYYVHGKLRDREEKNLALMPIIGLAPFSGYYYPTLLLETKDPDHPKAAELFMDYLYTEEGFAPWNTGIGTYSPNPNIKQHAGDIPFDMWSDILIGEDGDYIAENLGDVEDYVDNLMSK